MKIIITFPDPFYEELQHFFAKVEEREVHILQQWLHKEYPSRGVEQFGKR
jgi:hypothetical protein